MKIIVVQMGARRHYAIPTILNNEGCLSAFYTDLCFPGCLGKVLHKISTVINSPSLSKIARRTAPSLPISLVKNKPSIMLKVFCESKGISKDANHMYDLQNALFSESLIKRGYGDATMVYAMLHEGLPFLKMAKQNGLKIVVDVNAVPNLFHIERAEQSCFPDWEPPSGVDLKKIDSETLQTLDLADGLLCPSEKVMEELTNFPNFVPKKAFLVPYGFTLRPYKQTTQFPQTGRVLFAGLANLRKGIHYFAKAANKLCFESPSIRWDFRVAGLASSSVRKHPEARLLNFLGQLSTRELFKEFSVADVLVLPTLAEGSAGVVFEALSMGVPVITTPSAGSIITSGKEGILVSERNVGALSDAIYCIVSNRKLRQQMSNEASLTIQNYQRISWGKRLKQVLQTVNSA